MFSFGQTLQQPVQQPIQPVQEATKPLPGMFGTNTPIPRQNINKSPTTLQEIRELSAQLNTHIVSSGSLPPLDRDLNQIENQTRNLLKISGEPLDPRAQYLLANRGFDASRLRVTLNSLGKTVATTQVEEGTETDLDRYLEEHHNQIILKSIQEQKRRTAQDYEEVMTKSINRDWERAKQRIYEELGQQRKEGVGLIEGAIVSSDPVREDFGVQSFAAIAKSIGAPTSSSSSALPGAFPKDQVVAAPPSGGLQLHTKMMQYSKVVTELNRARLLVAGGDDRAEYDLMDAFYSACRNLDPNTRNSVDASNAMLDSWRLLNMMLNNPRRERLYAKQYRLQETDFSSSEAVAFRRTLARGARTFLQQQFALVVDRAVAQNPRVAMLGGKPGPLEKARAYINLMNARYGSWEPSTLELAQHPSLGTTPIWAEVYYLIRMGFPREALGFVQSIQTDLAMKGDGNFVAYLTAWVNALDTEDGRLPRSLRDQLLAEYNQRIRQADATGAHGLQRSNSSHGLEMPSSSSHFAGTSDPFKLAVYKIIGRCELNKKNIPGPHVIRAREDYLWLQLMLVQERFGPDEPVFERYTLREFAKLMLKFGANHFNPQGKLGDPLAWFTVLLTCGEFERAVQYLYNMDQYRVEAVHFAVALAYFGVLRVPETPMVVDNDLLSSKTIATAPSSLDQEASQSLVPAHHSTGLRRLDSLAPTTPTSPIFGASHRMSLRGNEPVQGTYEIVSLNFARLMHNYTRFFYRSDTVEALQYLYLICLYGKISDADTPAERNMATEYNQIAQRYVRDVVLDTRDFATLLGEVRSDGTRLPGEVEKSARLLNLTNTQEFVQTITRRAAEKAERDGGRFTEAVVLYNLAEEYDTVVTLLNKFLGERLSQQAYAVAAVGMDGQQASETVIVDNIDETLGVAQGLLSYYERNVNLASKISPENRAECNTLITLLRFMQDYQAGRFENALRRQIDLGWLPLEVLDAPSLVSSIRRRAAQVEEWDENISRNLSIVLVATMDSIYRVWKSIKNRSVGNANQAQLRELKSRADNLVMFAGMLQLRMAPEAYAKLSRLHVSMM